MSFKSNSVQRFLFSFFIFHDFCVIVSISIRNFAYFCLNRISSHRIALHRFVSMSVTVRIYEKCCVPAFMMLAQQQRISKMNFACFVPYATLLHLCIIELYDAGKFGHRYTQSSINAATKNWQFHLWPKVILNSPDSMCCIAFHCQSLSSVSLSFQLTASFRHFFCIRLAFVHVQCQT